MSTINFKAWINAFRLRTLPLAASGILLGSAIAHTKGSYQTNVLTMALVTTFLLQILSNLSNDYGDYSHGTDNAKRVGPKRTVQSGAISPTAMKIAITIVSILAFSSGVYLLMVAFPNTFSLSFLLFLLVGILSITAAIKYTVGKSNYGYKGLGDLMVFLFFGIIAVSGSFFLHSNSIDYLVLLPASSVGFLSAGVLNINNLRDHENDEKSKKNTLVVKLGYTKAKIYHTILIAAAFISMYTYIGLNNKLATSYWMALPGIIIAIHLFKIWKEKIPAAHDPELKRLSLTTLLFALVSGIILML